MSVALLALAAVVAADATSAAPGAVPAAPVAPWTLPPLHATRGPGAAVVDSSGRQVLLRGVNVNGLGDYYQADPAQATTVPLTDADYAEMASYGFNVIRLIVHWSALEPTRGQIDGGYLARIHHAVDQARANGLYVVFDMHQEAWGRHVASPPATTCPDGTTRSIGWDGAPEWATLTDGADTCHAGSSDDSPAVRAAFDNFYDDRDGIQTELALTWGALADEFADEPAVAGYDLLNEPSWGGDLATNAAKLGEFQRRAIAAIRQAEAARGGFPHIVFFEPMAGWPFPATTPPPDVSGDPNLVFAPHNHLESPDTGVTIEQGFVLGAAAGASYGTPFWFGAHGWSDDPAGTKAKLVRYGQAEDAHLVGGAWWQWTQACGDPHAIGTPGGTAPANLTLFHSSTCPGDRDRQVVPEWATVLSRPYPRAAPGHLQSLRSDGDTRTLSLVGAQDAGVQPVTQPLEVWVPDGGQGEPEVRGVNLFDLTVARVPGGYRVTATTCGTYALAVGTSPAPLTDGCPDLPATAVAGPTLATPKFTG